MMWKPKYIISSLLFVSAAVLAVLELKTWDAFLVFGVLCLMFME